MSRCFICERNDIPVDEMAGGRRKDNGVCLPCQRDYAEFRRAYKAEHGRWPTMREFKSDEEE